jgi:phosphoribosylglycinamide formyltransferase-1
LNNAAGTFIRLGVMASHGGTNLQAILDACSSGIIYGEVAVVISNNSNSYALERARKVGIEAIHLSSHTHSNPEELDMAIRDVMIKHKVDLVILAGYMKRLGKWILESFPNKVINSHPSLLPLHGGRGMYGDRVHDSVLKSGDKETGITIHLVDLEYDHGSIVSQTKVCVSPGDSVSSLRNRIQKEEHSFWIRTIERIRKREIDLGEISMKTL